MDINLLHVGSGTTLFYAEPASSPQANCRESGNWFERRWQALQVRLHRAESGAGKLLRRVERWLRRFETPDEPMLQDLRQAESITLVHPAAWEPAVALEKWRHYLRRQRRRHAFWLLVNGLISPLTILLAPLPGPNVIGYWFVYRAVCHLLALMGVGHARSRNTTTTERPCPLLDEPVDGSDDVGERLAKDRGWAGLRGFLERSRVMTSGTPHAHHATGALADTSD